MVFVKVITLWRKVVKEEGNALSHYLRMLLRGFERKGGNNLGNCSGHICLLEEAKEKGLVVGR